MFYPESEGRRWDQLDRQYNKFETLIEALNKLKKINFVPFIVVVYSGKRSINVMHSTSKSHRNNT